MAPVTRSQFIPKSVVLNPTCKSDPVVIQLKDINNSMRKIDAYVILGLKGKRKLLDDQRKKDLDNQRKADKLNLLKQQKANPINFIKDKLPRTGLLDSIRNFILYTFLGAAVPLFLKSLPAIFNFAKLLVPIGKGIGEFASNVLGGFVNAVNFGYKVHDKMRGILKTVTGAKYEKELDSLEKNLNIFLNGAIILGLTIAGSGVLPKIGGGKKVGGVNLSPNLNKSAYKNIRQSYKNLEGGRANIGDRLRLFRHGVIDATQLGSKTVKPAGKFFGKFGRIFGKIPVIGGLIDFTLSILMGEPVGRAAAKAVGSSIGFGLGALIPGLGQIGVGELIGSLVGDIIGGALYDTLSAFGKPKKHASGGSVGGKSVSRTPRTIKNVKLRRPGKQPRQKTAPGKNVGGEDAIKKLFPETKDVKTANPLGMLVKNSAIMKKAGIFGNLLGSGMEMMALGQRIEKSSLSGFENYLGYAIQSAIDDQSSANAKVIGNSMLAMATGGIVPASRTIAQAGASPGYVVAREIVKSFTAMLDSKSSEIFQNIRRELELKAPGCDNGTAPVEPGNGGLQVSSSSPDFWLLATAALFENNNPQSGYQGSADVAQAIYNRVSLPGWPKSIRDVILQKKQFEPVERYGSYVAWGAIKDKESALAHIKRYGHTQEELEAVSAAILDSNRQNSARTFVGARDNFRSVSYENANNHLDNATEQQRFGHVFGFEHIGLNTASFKAGKLSPAMINQQVVNGNVSQIQFGVGNVSLNEIRRLAESMGVPLSSYIRGPLFLGDTSYHISGRAMDFSNGYGPTPEMLKLAQTIVSRYGSSLAELFHTPLGYGIKRGKKVSLSELKDPINSRHKNHVHVAIVGDRRPISLGPSSISNNTHNHSEHSNPNPKSNPTTASKPPARKPTPTKPSRSPRISSFLGPGKLDETIFPPDFIKEFQKGKPNTSSITKPLKIASSSQFSKLQGITNVATGIYSGEDVTNTHFIRQTIIT